MDYGGIVQHLHLSPETTEDTVFLLVQTKPSLESKEVYFNCRKDGVLV